MYNTHMSRWVYLLLAVPLLAQDTHCPAYPVAARSAVEEGVHRDSDFSRYHFSRSQAVPRAVTVRPSNNFIDDAVFALMRRDGVSPAALTADGEFLRRVYLDLTG